MSLSGWPSGLRRQTQGLSYFPIEQWERAFWSPNGGVGSNPTPDTAFFLISFFWFWLFYFSFLFFFLLDLRTKTLPGGSNSLAHVFFFFNSFFFYRLGERAEPFQSPGFSK